MSYSLLKNTYSRKNDYVEHFAVDTASTSRIMSSYEVPDNQETTELEFPVGAGKKNKILSPDGNWKLELNKDGLQLFGPSGFKTTLISGGASFLAYKLTIGTDGNIVLSGGVNPANITFMWDTGAKDVSDSWSLNVDNNGNIIRQDINENNDGEKLFTKIVNNGASSNVLCYPGTNSPGTYYQRTLLSKDCKWRVELNAQGFRFISKDNRKITLYKPLKTTSVMKLLLNENGQLLLFEGDNVVLKTKSFISSTYNAVVNQDNGSIDISQGTDVKYKTFATDISSYDDGGLRSDQFKCIISGNSNYLLSVDNEGLYILDISSSSNDNKTWIYKKESDIPTPLIARIENYGEVKVYTQGVDSNRDCLWWAGTSETTNDNVPYKLSVTNTGKMLIMNKDNKGLIYKKLGPSANVSENLMIAVRQRVRGDWFWCPYNYRLQDAGESLIVAQFNPKFKNSNDQYPGQLWWFPSSKCMVQAMDGNYSLEIAGGSSNYEGEEGERLLFWDKGCDEAKSANITWDSNGYMNIDKYNKYINRQSDVNGDGGDHIRLYDTPKTKWDIVRISNTYTTIPTDSDCVMSPWSECDKMCKDGIQTRTKISSQSGEGKACDSENLTRTGSCGTTPCPVDCVLTEWSEWGRCSKDCGGGTKKRTRTKTKEGKYGGELCPPDSELKEEEECNTEACPLPGSVPPPPPPSAPRNDNNNLQPPPGGNTNSQPPPGGNTNLQPLPSAPRNDNTNSQPPPSQVIKAVESEDFISKYKWWVVGGITFLFFMIIIIVIVIKKKKTE